MGAFDIKKVEAEAEKKAKKLSEQMGCDVITHTVIDSKGEPATAYFTLPNRFTKMHAIDLANQSLSQSGDMLLNACLIKEESDKRILDDKPENDSIYLAFNMYASTLVEIANLNLQKKS